MASTPRGARRTKDRVTASAIVDAAMTVLDRDGATAVTMRAVATELGVSPGVLYWHIGDREELLAAMAQRWSDDLQVTADPDATWTDQLAQILEGAHAPLVDRPELMDLLHVEQQAVALTQVRAAVFAVLATSGADERQQQLFTRWLMFHLVGTARTEHGMNRQLTGTTGPPAVTRAESDEFFAYTTSVLLTAIRTEIIGAAGQPAA